MKKIFLVLIVFLFTLNLQAQSDVDMADALRADGKIYVVVAVLSIILLGVLFYIIRLDSKVSKMEKQLKNND